MSAQRNRALSKMKASNLEPASMSVIPAKAGIQFSSEASRNWIPAFAGMTARKSIVRKITP